MNELRDDASNLEDLPPELQARRGILPTLTALAALAIAVGALIWSWPLAQASLAGPIAEMGWQSVLLRPAALLFGLMILGEIGLGVYLAQATGEADGQSWVNWFSFVLVTIGSIIAEILTGLGFSPITLGLSLLIALGSLLVIIGTAASIFRSAAIGFRRNICSIVVPVYFAVPIWGFQKILECLVWDIQTHIECIEWIQRQHRTCAQWARQCRNWATRTRRTCKSWLPWPLDYLCNVFEVVTYVVCAAWDLVCVLFVIIVYLVCLAFLLIVLVICLVFLVIWIPVVLGWLIVVGLVRIIFWC